MQCYLFVGSFPKTTAAINHLCTDNHIASIDQVILAREENEKKEKITIGIEDVRLLQQKIYFKPLKSKKKAIIIPRAELLTIEAQNSLLKVLEEPPPDTFFFLATKTQESLLPTVQSRCQIISFKKQQTPVEKNDMQAFFHIVSLCASDNHISEKLYYAQKKGVTKEEAQLWVEQMICCAREHLIKLLKENNREVLALLSFIRRLEQAYFTLKTTNVTPRMALEHLLLTTNNET